MKTWELLAARAKGMLFPSETDAPLGTFFYPATSPESMAEALERAGAEVMHVSHFFAPVTRPEPWYNLEEQQMRRRWSELEEAIEDTLAEPRVFILGQTGTRFCWILGGVDGGCGGLLTHLVET